LKIKKRIRYTNNFIYVLIAAFVLPACADEEHIYYEVKGNEVLYHSVYRKGQEYYSKAHKSTMIVEEADPESFRQLSKYYGVDDTHVFHEARKLIKRDPASFKVVTKQLTVDAYGAYYKDDIIPNSHGLSFRTISDKYAIDDHQVYFISGGLPKVLNGADHKTFTGIGDTYSDYAKDKNTVFYQGLVIAAANPGKFKKLMHDFSKDDTSVFYKREQIPEADVSTFNITSQETMKESNYKYLAEDKENFFSLNQDVVVITKKIEVTNAH